MNSDRIKQIQDGTAYPDSHSVKNALVQVWLETVSEFESRTCKNCKYFLNKMSAQWCTKKGNPMIFIYNSKATTFSCSEWEKDR